MKSKRIFSLLLSSTLALGLLSSCGGTQDTPDSPDTPDAPNTEEIHSEAYEKIHSILKDSELYYLDETEALAPYYEMAEERKEAILNSPTKIVKSDEFIPGETYTGIAYYVSPNGNDANDGLSPETAWENILRVNDADLQEGDAVFFERGGVYRLTDDRLRLADYVTYSAYGEGAKPIITLVQENTAHPEYWELYYEGENGEKIWRFHEEIGEVGGIIFENEVWAERVLEWPTPDGWKAINVLSLNPVKKPVVGDACTDIWALEDTGEYRSVEQQLTENMSFVTRVNLSEVTYPTDFAEWRVYGGLYLRCDEGNPGECFDDIEIISRRETALYGMDGCMVHGAAEGYVLDNLSFKWYINNPVAGDLMYGNAIIQNCTAEWGASCLLTIVSPDEPTCAYHLVSDGFYGVANNATLRNNYIRQNASGITIESSMEAPKDMGTLTVIGNLIENCYEGFRISLAQDHQAERFDAVILQDNIVLDTGIGMSNGNWMTPAAVDMGWADVQYAETFEISDNVLLGSTLSVFYLPDMSRVQMNIHDNVIAQNSDGVLMNEIASDEFGAYARWHMMEDAK